MQHLLRRLIPIPTEIIRARYDWSNSNPVSGDYIESITIPVPPHYKYELIRMKSFLQHFGNLTPSTAQINECSVYVIRGILTTEAQIEAQIPTHAGNIAQSSCVYFDSLGWSQDTGGTPTSLITMPAIHSRHAEEFIAESFKGLNRPSIGSRGWTVGFRGDDTADADPEYVGWFEIEIQVTWLDAEGKPGKAETVSEQYEQSQYVMDGHNL